MNFKKFLAIIIIILVICTGAYIFYLQRNEVLENGQDIPKDAAKFSIEDRKITDDSKPFKINVVYPYIVGLDNLNKEIQEKIDKEIADFKNNSLENDEAVKKTDPESYANYPRQYELNIDYTRGEIDEDIASIVLNVYSFEGGAHGSTYPIAINYNVKDNKNITLADLFSGQEEYLKKISDYCISDLEKQVSEKMEGIGGSWINDGAGPSEENFSLFLINKDSIIFYFPQYQVAPYSAGQFTVTMKK